jgi:hypothetical protein
MGEQMIFVIPTDLLESNYPQTSTLDGTAYILELLWNARARRWFMTLSDTDGNRLISGRKLVANIVWGARDVLEALPPGDIWVRTGPSSNDADPGLRELGSRVFLMYVDTESATA